ncbi:hypothetical protein I3760_10G051500 [Carya illinoinensis]|nr:hypothetical protein I3760_10G051500 [Carya illinoinensis]
MSFSFFKHYFYYFYSLLSEEHIPRTSNCSFFHFGFSFSPFFSFLSSPLFLLLPKWLSLLTARPHIVSLSCCSWLDFFTVGAALHGSALHGSLCFGFITNRDPSTTQPKSPSLQTRNRACS